MSVNEIRRSRDANRNKERLYYKFCAMYFENLHKDIYDNAIKLLQEVKKKESVCKGFNQNPRIYVSCDARKTRSEVLLH